MTPERWQRIKALLEAALEREGETRARSLSEATQDDPPVASNLLGLLVSEGALSLPTWLAETLAAPAPSLAAQGAGRP